MWGVSISRLIMEKSNFVPFPRHVSPHTIFIEGAIEGKRASTVPTGPPG